LKVKLSTPCGLLYSNNVDPLTRSRDITNGWAAVEIIPKAGLLQIIAFVVALELFVMKDITRGEFIAKICNGALDFGWKTFDEETKLQKHSVELNNGRAAMMGVFGLIDHKQLGETVPNVSKL
jgi:hypothetical protein